jgi:hypothetical protein
MKRMSEITARSGRDRHTVVPPRGLQPECCCGGSKRSPDAAKQNPGLPTTVTRIALALRFLRATRYTDHALRV